MDTRCPICDSTDLDAREMPNDHPHHTKVRGRRCGRFVEWLTNPAEPIPEHCLDAARPRPAPVELVGTKAPVRWANSGDCPMSVQTRIASERCKPLVLDDQGIDSGSSGIMRRIKEARDLGGPWTGRLANGSTRRPNPHRPRWSPFPWQFEHKG